MALLRTGAGLADVVVTGVTSTTALATDAEEAWRLLLDGRSGVRTLERPFVDEFDLPVRIGGPLLEDFDHHLNRVELRRFSYLQKMATVLSRRLWDAAELGEIDTTRLMVSIGLALGTTEEIVEQYDTFKKKGMRAVSPLAIQMFMPNAPAAAVGLERKAKAGIVSPLMADASGAAAIAAAWRHIALGEADVAICGGIDTWIGPVTIAAYHQLGLLSTGNDAPERACRPFAADRDGTVFTEGGALLLVESERHARERGAPILARLMGAGITSDEFNRVLPDPSGQLASDAIARAVHYAGVRAADIGLIIANADGTGPGDLAEAAALHGAFDGNAPPVYAPKSALGHSWGAMGAVNAVLAVQALRDHVTPPTLNVETLDPAIDLDVVTGQPRSGNYRYALADCFGFGGHNVALVLGTP